MRVLGLRWGGCWCRGKDRGSVWVGGGGEGGCLLGVYIQKVAT